MGRGGVRNFLRNYKRALPFPSKKEKILLIAKWNGSGKRVKRSMHSRRLKLYGQKFRPRERQVLSDSFIEQACLNEKGVFDAVVLSLKTDFGLYIQVKGDHKFRSGPLSSRGEELKADLAMTDEERELMKEQAKLDQIADFFKLASGESKPASPPASPSKKGSKEK
jgi:hypothetical protein